MDFREASPNKSRASTSGGRKSTGETSKAARDRLVPLAQRKPTKSTTALSRKRSRQEVLEEEQEFVSSDGDFEPIEDDTDDGGGDSGRVASAPSKRLRRSTSKSASEQCLEALRKLRDKVSYGTLISETCVLTPAESASSVNRDSGDHCSDDASKWVKRVFWVLTPQICPSLPKSRVSLRSKPRCATPC